MNRIEKAEFLQIKYLFDKFITLYPTINAVISNEQDGFVYSDTNRNNLFICAKFGWSLLITDGSIEMSTFFSFIKANNEIPDYIHLYAPSNTFISYIKNNWPKYKLRKRYQLKYLNRTPTYNYTKVLPSGFSLVKIQDIDFSKLEIFKFDLDKRYWNSKDDFMKNAIGVCLVNLQNEPIAICYSICIADKVAEVEIFILSEYRGKGFGYIVAEYFLNLTIEKRVIAHWDTFTENTPSFELAKKLGFQKIQEYELISIFLRDW